MCIRLYSGRCTSPVGIMAEDGHVGIGLGLAWREKLCSLESGLGLLQWQRGQHEMSRIPWISQKLAQRGDCTEPSCE